MFIAFDFGYGGAMNVSSSTVQTWAFPSPTASLPFAVFAGALCVVEYQSPRKPHSPPPDP